MSEYIFDVVNQASKLDWAMPFQRTGQFPLDKSSIFSSLEDAQFYASGAAVDERGLGGTSYVGQPISVYDNIANSITLYIIDVDRSLKAVGSASLGDNTSIEIIEDKIQLKDFGTNYYAYIPAIKDESGNVIEESKYEYTEGFIAGLEPRITIDIEGNLVLGWYEPSTETAEGIAANLEAISKRVESVENTARSLSSSITTLEIAIDNKANADQVYSKQETESLIQTAVSEADHLKRKTVAGVESIDIDAADADTYIYMVPNQDGNYDEYMVMITEDGNRELEKVGDWSVDLSGYATKEEVLNITDNKVDQEENHRLISYEEAEKLGSIENGAEKNLISSVSEDFSLSEDGYLDIASIAQSKVKNLASDLQTLQNGIDNKVDRDSNARLITYDELDRLNAIKDLVQSINSQHFTLSDEGQLNLNDVSISKIVGLQDILNKKVDVIIDEETGEEWTLLSPAEKNKLAALTMQDGIIQGLLTELERAKLDGIQEGAEKNYISSTTAEFTVVAGELGLVSIDVVKVNGIDNKINTALSPLQSKLNQMSNEFIALEDRVDELDLRLTWQPV